MREGRDPILAADLIGYVRLTGTVPSFVLPVFRETAESDPDTLVQMIGDGVVREFVPFDAEAATIHVGNLTSCRVKSGDPALLGYECTEGDVIVQTRSALKEELRWRIWSRELADKPFSRGELARFCDDEEAQREAEQASLELLKDRAPGSANYFRAKILEASARCALATVLPHLDARRLHITIGKDNGGIMWSFDGDVDVATENSAIGC